MQLTHLWIEAPLLSNALDCLPPEVVVLQPEPGRPPLANARQAQAILASSGLRYDGAAFAQLPNLRILVRTGIGLDNVDLDAATAQGVVVCNTPDGPTESTAEHTVALMLALAKRVVPGHTAMARGEWPSRSTLIGNELQGKTLGLIGLGRIGRRVAQICGLGLGMQVMAHDPYVDPQVAHSLGVALADLETVLAQADVLSLHAPSLPETRRMIDRRALARMKAGAYLINVARGSLVDTEALLEALDTGRLAGAGLDVFEPEPLPPDSPLRNHPRVILTPHSASVTVEGRARIERMAVERVLAFFRGEIPPDVCNPQVYRERP